MSENNSYYVAKIPIFNSIYSNFGIDILQTVCNRADGIKRTFPIQWIEADRDTYHVDEFGIFTHNIPENLVKIIQKMLHSADWELTEEPWTVTDTGNCFQTIVEPLYPDNEEN